MFRTEFDEARNTTTYVETRNPFRKIVTFERISLRLPLFVDHRNVRTLKSASLFASFFNENL